MTSEQLCNLVNWARCCIGDKGLELIDALHKGHNVQCCYQELLFMSRAIKILENHIPAGTLMSDPGSPACGFTNTVIGFAPTPPLVSFVPTVATYNGNPFLLPSAPTLITFMDNVISALTNVSGVTWSYTQVSTWEFILCAPYTRNGDTVVLIIEVFSEASLGFLNMVVTLSGGVAPATPVYRLESQNCLTENQIAILSGRFCKIKVKKPFSVTDLIIDAELRDDLLNIELR